MEKQFLVEIIEEDLEEKFKDDLKSHVAIAIGEYFNFNDGDGVSFSVSKIE